MNLKTIIETAPDNEAILRTLLVTNMQLERHNHALVSVSGGSDSDIMIDIIERIGNKRCKITYVFYDTGLEYRATKRHLEELEKRYGIRIERRNPKKPIPLSCKECGAPFISKTVSANIARLQKHGFEWEDKTFDELHEKYPKCKAALRWWCNEWGNKSTFNINRNAFLKEFMIWCPPLHEISDKCCENAKKKVAYACNKEFEPDLIITGVRRAEGGQRATAYKNCYSVAGDDGIAEYRMLFFFSDQDKAVYKSYYGIEYSDCYEVYGLKRTGCVGCPFASGFEQELEILQKYEPALYTAAVNTFGGSYEYIRRYREFKEQRKRFVKMLMSTGIQRNAANELAAYIQKTGVPYKTWNCMLKISHAIDPYVNIIRSISNNIKIMSTAEHRALHESGWKP